MENIERKIKKEDLLISSSESKGGQNITSAFEIGVPLTQQQEYFIATKLENEFNNPFSSKSYHRIMLASDIPVSNNSSKGKRIIALFNNTNNKSEIVSESANVFYYDKESQTTLDLNIQPQFVYQFLSADQLIKMELLENKSEYSIDDIKRAVESFDERFYSYKLKEKKYMDLNLLYEALIELNNRKYESSDESEKFNKLKNFELCIIELIEDAIRKNSSKAEITFAENLEDFISKLLNDNKQK